MAKTGSKWQKIMSVFFHISEAVHHMIVICVTQVWNDDIFSFFSFFFLNDKKFYLSCSISQELYIIWLSFVVHKCKMITSQGFFHFFKILVFQFVSGLKGQKWPKMARILSIVLHISGTIHHKIFIYDTHVKWYYFKVFLISLDANMMTVNFFCKYKRIFPVIFEIMKVVRHFNVCREI